MSNATIATQAASYIGYNNDGQYAKTVLADGPLRYYKLDELTGNNVAVDSSGNGGVSGTWGSTVAHIPSITATDYTGGAASFVAGTTSYDPNAVVTIPYEAAAIPSGSFSIEFITTLFGGASNIGAGMMTIVELQAPTGIQIGCEYNNGQMFISVAGVQLIAGGSFFSSLTIPVHVVVTYNAATKLLSYYSNGGLRNTATASTAPTFTSATGLRIGQDIATNPSMNGTADNVALYNYQLTPAQILAHAKACGSTNSSNDGGSVPRAIEANAKIFTVTQIQSIAAASNVTANIMVAATLNAASQVAQSAKLMQTAQSRLTANATRSNAAGSAISVLALGTLNAASILASQAMPSQNGAASRIIAIGDAMITAQSSLSQYGHANVNAALEISNLIVASINAASILSHKLNGSLGAGGFILGTGMASANAGAEIAEFQFLPINAAASVSAESIATESALSRISATFDLTINASASVAARSMVHATAQSYVVVSNDLSITGDAYIIVHGTQAIGAGAFIPIRAQIAATAAARIVILQYSYAIIEALSAVVTQANASASGGAYIAFTVTSGSLQAGATISQPFTPTLYAHAYIVTLALLPLAAGARVGVKNKSVANRELIVAPYYG